MIIDIDDDEYDNKIKKDAEQKKLKLKSVINTLLNEIIIVEEISE